jgi:glycosyltransferase involved in cell wall biosynthesis
MRILYFHQHFSTPQGSAGTRSYEMARALVGEGHEVTMVCGSYSQGNTGLNVPFKNGVRQGTIDGIDVIEFELAYANDMGFLLRTWIFIKFALRSSWVALSKPADVVFASSTPLTAGIPGILSRWLRGRRFVFEVRDLWPELPEAMGVIRNPVVLTMMSWLEWLSYKSAHRLIGLSPGIVDGIARRGIPKNRICMVPNGCDLDTFHPNVTGTRPDSIKDKEFLAVFTGTHGLANGLDAVLDAAAELKRLGRTDISIALIGRGSEKKWLQQRAKSENLNNVVFLDPVSKVTLANYLSGADAGLQILRNVPAFYYGTSPNKFFDYIAAGLPVINNYPGWLAELIEDNRCGLAIPPENARKLADALIKLADDETMRARMSINARTLAETRFGRKKLAKNWVEWVLSS